MKVKKNSSDLRKKYYLESENDIFKDRTNIVQFIENIGHDLRIPCAGIISTTKILQGLETNSLKTELLNDILCASNILLNIIYGIYDFDYAFSGNLIIENKKIAIHSLIQNIAITAKPLAQQKRLLLFTDIDKNIPEFLIGNEYRITRILINLVNNAVKFTQEGTVKISAKLIKQDENQAIVQFTVGDTGIGISKDKQKIIFQRLEQLKSQRQNCDFKSKGLGLAVVKQFVQDLNGEIGLVSTVGKGSIFTFSLPLKLFKSTKKIKKVSEKLPSIIPLNILLVEDDLLSQKANQMLIESKLTKLPLTTVNLGSKALKLIKKNNYDVVFLDLELTDSNGLELAKKISKIKKISPLIIALTAHVNQTAMKSANINAYLTKPLDIKKAQAIIKKFFLPTKKLKLCKLEKPSNLKAFLPTNIEMTKKRLNFKNNSYLQSLTEMLLEELPTIKKNLKSAFIKNDLEQIKQITHKLQGSAGYCGIYHLKKISADLENAIENKKSKKSLDLLLPKILTAIDKVLYRK